MPLTYAPPPSLRHTTARGSLIERWRSAGVALVFKNCGLPGVAKRCWFKSATPAIAPMFAGSKVAMRMRRLLRALSTKRCSFGP